MSSPMLLPAVRQQVPPQFLLEKWSKVPGAVANYCCSAETRQRTMAECRNTNAHKGNETFSTPWRFLKGDKNNRVQTKGGTAHSTNECHSISQHLKQMFPCSSPQHLEAILQAGFTHTDMVLSAQQISDYTAHGRCGTHQRQIHRSEHSSASSGSSGRVVPGSHSCSKDYSGI